MKSTGRYSEFEELEDKPSKPFKEDLKKDLESIDKYFIKSKANEIKIQLMDMIIQSMK